MAPLSVRVQRVMRYYAYRLQRNLLGKESPAHPTLSNSIPKAGSNLILRCLELMPGLVYTRTHLDIHTPFERLERAIAHLHRGEFVTAHLPYTPEVAHLLQEHHVSSLLMVRDPRDVVVSHIYWVTYVYTRGRFHPYFRSLPDDDARLMASIRGTPPLPDGFRLEDIGTRFRNYLQWTEHGSYLVRFEDLIGPGGGGNRERQIETIRKIGQHVGLDLSVNDAERIADRLFDPRSPTFRKGRIGDWRAHFREEHKEVFKELAGDVLVQLGYEKDLNW